MLGCVCQQCPVLAWVSQLVPSVGVRIPLHANCIILREAFFRKSFSLLHAAYFFAALQEECEFRATATISTGAHPVLKHCMLSAEAKYLLAQPSPLKRQGMSHAACVIHLARTVAQSCVRAWCFKQFRLLARTLWAAGPFTTSPMSWCASKGALVAALLPRP